MKFSVIVGTYNQKDTLGKTLEALYTQSLPKEDFEVLVCDDGSDYNVEEHFSFWKDKLNLQFFTQPHKGMRLAKNLNQGIKKAKGQYIVTIMADTYPSSTWLEEFDWIKSPSNIYSSFRVYVDEAGVTIGYDWRFGGKAPQDLGDILPADPNEPWKSMTGNGFFAHRRFYTQVGGWPEEYEGYGRDDWVLCLRAKRLGYKMFTDPQAIIFHIGKVDTPDNPASVELFEKELANG